MNENITKFLEKFAADEALQAKFSALASPEEAYELAKTIQDGFTKEEFLEAARAITEQDEGDISDEDLAAAAGGEDGEVIFTKVSEAITDVETAVSKGVSAVSKSVSAVTESVGKSATKVFETAGKSIIEVAKSVDKVPVVREAVQVIKKAFP